MAEHETSGAQPGTNRRDFLKVAAATAASAPLAGLVHAAASETIQIGLVGCGGRGKGAMTDAIEASDRVRVVALADVFADRIDEARKTAEAKGQKIPQDQCFVGFDAFQKLLQTDVDIVLLATPPHFRPQQLRAAVEAKKHIFTEKPVAVDPVGIRHVLQTAELAKKEKLSIVAGTQRRHQQPYLETLKRIQDGAIGDITAARVYWNGGQLWFRERASAWNDMEWMIRDWVNWCWLSGDHIVEQHVHNLDVVNWFTGKHPTKAIGMGGRARRVTGDQFDFFAVDFEYEGGAHAASYCRQINGCDHDVSETFIGEKGEVYTDQPGRCKITGPNAWQWPRKEKFTNPYVQEHIDLIASVTEGKGLNELTNVATSTLTAIMGRLAAYTGKVVTWDELLASDLRLGPTKYDWEVRLPEVQVPVPGRA